MLQSRDLFVYDDDDVHDGDTSHFTSCTHFISLQGNNLSILSSLEIFSNTFLCFLTNDFDRFKKCLVSAGP